VSELLDRSHRRRLHLPAQVQAQVPPELTKGSTMAKDPDRIDEILADDEFIDSLNGGNPTDGWGKV
jgi:hypothetical protein